MVMLVSVEMVCQMSSVHMLELQLLFIVMILMVVVEVAKCNGVSGL